ncbi:DUF983 domain-containing protein [Polaribacter sargassicola]|uniref:DUF983 domain-containing protein n=1 Tax=Polaribacter sargassicola TaxID=2836891 RepID=UPI001F336ABB|nr:DUF983 domain-containing protein [Polaribacter sp. DS7-9]MCG1036236.1 DUF983 domain-containing protein [Polaribacter sp. DS7-9]
MFKKGTKLYSIFNNKCPKCHEGEFFEHKLTYNPGKVTKLHENCPKCNLKYMMEPSFFYGAMYVNYGITVAVSVATFVIAAIFFSLTLLQSFAAIVIVLLILAPINMRLARIIWINMFVSYKTEVTSNKK